MERLKPCPFCGGNAKVNTFISGGVPSYSAAIVKCEKCHGSTTTFYDTGRNGKFIFDAIKAWNRRTQDVNFAADKEEAEQ